VFEESWDVEVAVKPTYALAPALLMLIAAAAGGQVFVDDNPPGTGNNGTSWADACTSLAVALANTATGDIWVAEGTYYPTGATRAACFQLKSGVNLYGGFANGARTLADRDWSAHRTILSGDVGVRGLDADNSHHVVVGADRAALDGFFITQGRADQTGGGPEGTGGGMLNSGVSPVVRNCAFSGCYASSGGGMSIVSAAPVVEDCSFLSNSNLYAGGAINITGANATGIIRRCTFVNNTGGSGGAVSHGAAAAPTYESCAFTGNAGGNGGAVCCQGAAAVFRRCLFRGNNAMYNAGTVWNRDCAAAPVFDSCTFAGSRNAFGVMLNDGASPLVTNCLFVQNGKADPGCHQGGICNQNGASPTVAGCTFLNNVGYSVPCMASYGGAALVKQCVFSGNRGGSSALYFKGGAPRVENCVFVGNGSGWSGGALQIDSDTTGVVVNCTFSENRGNFGGAIGNAGGCVFVANCVLWNDRAQSYGNEIYNNSNGLVRVAFSDIRRGWDGPEVFNQEAAAGTGRVLNAGGNIRSLPRFADGVWGTWSADGAYDAEAVQTVLTDTNANWKAGELAGRFVNPDLAQPLQFLVVTNTPGAVTVWGDAASLSTNGATYRICDPHLQSKAGRWTPQGWARDAEHSPCIDAGDPQSPWAGEPEPNGRRVNMGAEGNTARASKSL
jgi:hypothetical protein